MHEQQQHESVKNQHMGQPAEDTFFENPALQQYINQDRPANKHKFSAENYLQNAARSGPHSLSCCNGLTDTPQFSDKPI
jgi:hypothetical protein